MNMLRIAVSVSMLSVFMLSGCGDKATLSPEAVPSALPALPADRKVSDAATERLGRDSAARSANVYDLANWAYLPVHEGGASWALYELTVSDETPVAVVVEV